MWKNLLQLFKKTPDSICEKVELPETLCLFFSHEWGLYTSAWRILVVILYYMGIAYICYVMCPYNNYQTDGEHTGDQQGIEQIQLPDDEVLIEVAVEQIMRDRRHRRRQLRHRRRLNGEDENLSPTRSTDLYDQIAADELRDTDEVIEILNTIEEETNALFSHQNEQSSRDSSVSSNEPLTVPLGQPSESQKELAIISTKEGCSSTTIAIKRSSDRSQSRRRSTTGEDGDNADCDQINSKVIQTCNDTVDNDDVDEDIGKKSSKCPSIQSERQEIRHKHIGIKKNSSKKPAKLNVKRSAQNMKQPDLWKMYDARTRARAKRMRRNKEAANIDPSKWKIVGIPRYPTNQGFP